MRIRDWLGAKVGQMAPLVVLWLRYRRTRRPSKAHITVQGLTDTPDHTVHLGFLKDNSALPNAFHTVALLEAGDVWVWLNLDLRSTLAIPVTPEKDMTPDGVLFMNGADYVVSVPSEYHKPKRWLGVIGPSSCTVLAKKLIGLHDDTIWTAGELLEWLADREV